MPYKSLPVLLDFRKQSKSKMNLVKTDDKYCVQFILDIRARHGVLHIFLLPPGITVMNQSFVTPTAPTTSKDAKAKKTQAVRSFCDL